MEGVLICPEQKKRGTVKYETDVVIAKEADNCISPLYLGAVFWRKKILEKSRANRYNKIVCL